MICFWYVSPPEQLLRNISPASFFINFQAYFCLGGVVKPLISYFVKYDFYFLLVVSILFIKMAVLTNLFLAHIFAGMIVFVSLWTILLLRIYAPQIFKLWWFTRNLCPFCVLSTFPIFDKLLINGLLQMASLTWPCAKSNFLLCIDAFGREGTILNI